MLMKKLAASLLVASACLTSAMAQPMPEPVLSAKAWLLLDETSGQVIASHAATTRIEPASLTKIMTAYVVFDALNKKEVTPGQLVVISTRAWKVPAGSSKMFLEPGSKVSVDELLRGLMIQSGNDAAIALAEAVSGSVEAFVARMNDTAAKLGLHATRFASPHGLPDPNTYSTASDLSILATRFIRDYPQLYKTYDSAKQFTFNKITQPNRNRLLWADPSVDGMKTGHTDSAGYCLVSTAVRGDRRILVVVVGTDSEATRAEESLKLLNWSFQNFDTVKLFDKSQPGIDARVWEGTAENVKLGPPNPVSIAVPRGKAGELKPVAQRTDPLIAPLAKGQQVGTLQFTLDGKVLRTEPLVVQDAVERAGFFGRMVDTVKRWFQ